METSNFCAPKGMSLNKYSVFLSKEENEVIFKLIGPQCQALFTAFGHLTINTEKVGVTNHTGYMCLMKNSETPKVGEMETTYLRMYTLECRELIWQQRITANQKFTKVSATMLAVKNKLNPHTVVDLNFSSTSEMQEFFEIITMVMTILQIKKHLPSSGRKVSRKNSVRVFIKSMLGIQKSDTQELPHSEIVNPPLPKAFVTTKLEDNTSKVFKKKMDISPPSDFRHISHGFNGMQATNKKFNTSMHDVTTPTDPPLSPLSPLVAWTSMPELMYRANLETAKNE